MMPIRVFCYYRLERNCDLNSEYVDRLYQSVCEHLPDHFSVSFVCISRETFPYFSQVIPVESWRGFWGKMLVFGEASLRDSIEGEHINLYLDLDTIVQKDLTPILDLALMRYGRLVACDDRMFDGAMNSSVMAWVGCLGHLTNQFYAQFGKDGSKLLKRYTRSGSRYGDQGFIQDHLIEPFVPLRNLVASYKLSKLEEKKEAIVVFFHGRPRPHQVGWMPW